MQKQHNAMINEDIVVPRLVNTQTIEFSDWCARMANGSTVTAADVAAVMQQIENKMLENLTLNAKIVCSPGGLIFRPKVSGSITQSQLKAKLQARKTAETDPIKAAAIDVNRALTTSDLAVSDCSVSIEVDLPKSWSSDFQKQAVLKRVNKGVADSTDGTENGSGGGSNTNSTNNTNDGSGSGGSNTNPTNAVEAPVLSGSTPFAESTSVTITGPSGAQIHYTTDGSTPTSESTLYSEAISLSETTTVKAIAIKDGTSSDVASKTFTKSSGGADAN